MGDEGEACRSLVDCEHVLSSPSDSRSSMGEAVCGHDGTVDGELDESVGNCSIACSEESPVPSKPVPDVRLTLTPDSIELRLLVLLRGSRLVCSGDLASERRLMARPDAETLGGNIEICLGLSAGGRMICDAPFLYDK